MLMERRALIAALGPALLEAAACSKSRGRAEIGRSFPLGKGNFTVSRSDARLEEGKLWLSVFFSWTGPAEELLGGYFGPDLEMTLLDNAGNEYKPIRPRWSVINPVPEEIYHAMRDFDAYYTRRRDSSFERDAAENAARVERLEAELRAGRYPTRWMHIFEVPLGGRELKAVVTNPDRQAGQARTVEVALGR